MTHEGTHDQPQLATGSALRAYLDAEAAPGRGNQPEAMAQFDSTMFQLLSKNMDRSPDGVDPQGYVMATQMVIYDCKETGKDGFTEEPMPREVTGLPPLMYGLFQGRSVELAAEAFGKPFGDAVKEVYAQLRAHNEATTNIGEAATAEGTSAYEALKQIEGIDPVEAVLDGHPKDIPQEGWVVDANLQLGKSGIINVYRYGHGAEFKKSLDYKDGRAEYGHGAIWMTLPSEGTGQYTALYESPQFPLSQRNQQPYERMTTASYAPIGFAQVDISELSDGGRLLCEKDPIMNRGMARHVGWTDIDRLAEKNGTAVELSRVTEDQESLQRIVRQLGQAMGMGEQGVTILGDDVKAKTQRFVA